MTCKDKETVSPDDNIVAVIVDVRKPSSSSGALYILERRTGGYLDMVGLECKGYNVIVPWRSGLELLSLGECRVALVPQIPHESQVPQSDP